MPSKSGSKKGTKKAAASKSAAPDAVTSLLGPVPPERTQFRQFLLANPNHFGTLEASVFKPVKLMSSNATFEQLMCVGFNPQLDQLEAVVYLRRNNGYGGGVCGSGTPEYVRFYLTYDDGATWEDAGMTSFTAYDIPGAMPVEFAVTLPVEVRKRFCSTPNLPRVRAILSWNDPPTPGTPGFTPVYGNVREANIQIEPFWLLGLFPLLQIQSIFSDLQLAPNVLSTINDSLTTASTAPKALSASTVHRAYRGKDVPDHRSLFPFIQKQLNLTPVAFQPILGPAVAPPPPTAAGPLLPITSLPFADLKVDISSIIKLIQQTDGNTNFEELNCVGLDTNNDWLVGVLSVKLSNGYSGSLCSDGSREYVAFWVDWGDGAGWEHVGTTSVRVHDINPLPDGGLQYAVFQPLNTVHHRRPCNQGAVVARVRAILSWEEEPPAGNPDWVPTWGNREETRVLIKPGPQIVPGDVRLYIESVGGQPVCTINQATGFVGERPFGGLITITGFIPSAPDIGATPFKYKVSVRQLSPLGSWQPLTNSFNVSVIEGGGGSLPSQFPMPQSVDSDGYYTFLEDMDPGGSGWRIVQGRVLAHWHTAAPMEGRWEIKVEVKNPIGPDFPSALIACPDGSTVGNVKVYLDEVAPEADVKITGFTRGGGPVQPAVDCATIQVGDVIHGTYKALDDHFGSLTLTVQPSGPANGATVNPPARTYPGGAPPIGEEGTWTLETEDMERCGYVIRLVVSDRTIVNNGGHAWQAEDFVGFCLAEPEL